MVIDEDLYLAHYGVPGMKWGVRRKNLRDANANVKAAKAQRNAARKEMAKSVGTTAAIGIGIGLVGVILAKSGSNPISAQNTAPFRSAGKNWVTEAATGEALDIAIRNMPKQR